MKKPPAFRRRAAKSGCLVVQVSAFAKLQKAASGDPNSDQSADICHDLKLIAPKRRTCNLQAFRIRARDRVQKIALDLNTERDANRGWRIFPLCGQTLEKIKVRLPARS